MTMTGKSPLITLNNGVKMPVLGLGVLDRSAREQTAGAVQCAIANGYRLIDTAAAYGNERQVGEGLRASGIDRAEMFITTKLWMSDYGYEPALRAFDRSRRQLGVDYVDLYLLHWPMPSNFDATVAAYQAAEQLLAKGAVRAIGGSNFKPTHLHTLMERTDVVPAVNQIEVHPYYLQRDLRETNARLDCHGVMVAARSQRSRGARSKRRKRSPRASDCRRARREVSQDPGAVVLRWHMDHGFVTIPKSFRPQRIAENIDIFGFTLTAEDLAAIDAMDLGLRGGPDPDQFDLTRTTFRVEDETPLPQVVPCPNGRKEQS
jgi:diketogulonate reductase-like aldo/keto reductase